MKYESEEDIHFNESGIDFWPSKHSDCYSKQLNFFSNKCTLDLKFPEETNHIKIGNDEYNIENLDEIFDKYDYHDWTKKLYKIFRKDFSLAMDNPGIPVFLVF